MDLPCRGTCHLVHTWPMWTDLASTTYSHSIYAVKHKNGNLFIIAKTLSTTNQFFAIFCTYILRLALIAVFSTIALNHCKCMIVSCTDHQSVMEDYEVQCQFILKGCSWAVSIFNNRMELSIHQLRQPETLKRRNVWRRNFACRSLWDCAGHGLGLMSIGVINGKKIVL